MPDSDLHSLSAFGDALGDPRLQRQSFRACHVFQRLVDVPPRSVDVAMAQGTLHIGHRHASA